MGGDFMEFDPKERIAVNKTIRLDSELVQTIYKEAGKRKLSFNKFVTQCIEYSLKNLKNTEEDT